MQERKKSKLAIFLKEECIMPTLFAKKIKICPQTLNNYLNGGKLPGLRLAYEIEKATHGHVKIMDWLKE